MSIPVATINLDLFENFFHHPTYINIELQTKQFIFPDNIILKKKKKLNDLYRL